MTLLRHALLGLALGELAYHGLTVEAAVLLAGWAVADATFRQWDEP